MDAVRIRFWSAQQLAKTAAAIQTVVVAWAEDWGLAADTVEVDCAAALPPVAAMRGGSEHWRECWGGVGQEGGGDSPRQVWCDWEPTLPAALARMVFPNCDALAPGAALSSGAGDAAFESLLGLLRERCIGEPGQRSLLATVDPLLFRRGSGALRVKIGLNSGSELAMVECLLPDPVVARLLGIGPTQVSPPAALGTLALVPLVSDTPVRLCVEAGSALIGAGSLLSIAVGDVIRLDTPLDGPFSLTLAPGHIACHGYIGRVDQHLALELTK